MGWVRWAGIAFAALGVWATLALGLPPAVAAVQAVFLALGVWGAFLLARSPGAATALLVLAGVGSPLFLILAVPAGMAWRRSGRAAAAPRPPGTAR